MTFAFVPRVPRSGGMLPEARANNVSTNKSCLASRRKPVSTRGKFASYLNCWITDMPHHRDTPTDLARVSWKSTLKNNTIYASTPSPFAANERHIYMNISDAHKTRAFVSPSTCVATAAFGRTQQRTTTCCCNGYAWRTFVRPPPSSVCQGPVSRGIASVRFGLRSIVLVDGYIMHTMLYTYREYNIWYVWRIALRRKVQRSNGKCFGRANPKVRGA